MNPFSLNSQQLKDIVGGNINRQESVLKIEIRVLGKILVPITTGILGYDGDWSDLDGNTHYHRP